MGTTSVTCSFRFEAAHHLPLHPGKCHRLHGHGYRLDVTVSGDVGEGGMVMDFADIRAVVEAELVDKWDHQLLNDFVENPTAELLARRALEILGGAGLAVAALRLWETPDCWVDVVP